MSGAATPTSAGTPLTGGGGSGGSGAASANSSEPPLPEHAMGCGGHCRILCSCCDSNREDVLSEEEHNRLRTNGERAQSDVACCCRECAPCRTVDRPDEAWGWAWHAWVRAVYAISASAFLAPYLTTVAGFAQNDAGYVKWLGLFSMRPTSYFSIVSTVAALCAAVLLPFMGSLADYSPHRKQLLIVANTIGSFAAIAMIIIVPSLWWLGGILFIIGSVSYEATLVYIYPYLPEIAPNGKETKRSRISAVAVVYGNGSQVLIAIVLSALLLVAAPADPEFSNPSFEDESLSPWSVTNALNAYAQNDNANDGHWSALVDNTGPLDNRTSSTAMMAINCTALPKVFKGRKMLLSAFVSTDDAYTNPAYQLNVFDGVSWSSSVVEKAGSSYGADVRVIKDMSNSADRFQVQIALLDGAVYHVDDLTVTPDASLLQPLCMAITGLWWFGFGFQAFKNLYPRPRSRDLPKDTGYCWAGIAQIGRTLSNIRGHGDILLFLIGYMFYDNGLSAILGLIGTFLQVQLRMSAALIGISLLWAQIVGIFGAMAMYKLGQKWSIKGALLISMFLFFITPILAWAFLRTPADQLYFFLVAIPAGTAIGGSIAMTRTMYTGMIPKTQEAEFMGLLSFFSKITLWSGTLVYAVVNEVTGQVGTALLSISGFFFVSIVFFALTPYDEAAIRARTAAANAARAGTSGGVELSAVPHPSDSARPSTLTFELPSNANSFVPTVTTVRPADGSIDGLVTPPSQLTASSSPHHRPQLSSTGIDMSQYTYANPQLTGPILTPDTFVQPQPQPQSSGAAVDTPAFAASPVPASPTPASPSAEAAVVQPLLAPAPTPAPVDSAGIVIGIPPQQ